MITHHPLNPLDRIAMAEMRSMVESTKATVTGISAREPFDELMERTPPPEGVTHEKAEVGGVLGWWCRPINAPHDAAILTSTGGAYVVGSARARVSAFVPEHSLGPGHPFLAAVEDAQASLAGLVEHSFGRIVLAGDSAGGGLALSLLSLVVAEAREGPRVRPAGAAVMSPWTDLALSGASMQRVRRRTPS
jgi:epsilon-lactone hydrolase